jgi:hypothetical protein
MPDATLEIRVEFKDFLSSKETCPYELVPIGAVFREGKDGKGRPRKWWQFPDRVALHVGHYQKKETYKIPRENSIPTTIRLDKPNGILQLKIVGKDGKGDAYHPVGIAFSRADGTPPVGVSFTTGATRPKDNPFAKIKFNEDLNTIEIDMVRIPNLHSHQEGSVGRTHRTYRFMVFIQEAATGKIGIVDPELENEN